MFMALFRGEQPINAKRDRRRKEMKSPSDRLPRCDRCNVKDKICVYEDGHGPDFCPTINLKDVIDRSRTEYQRPEIREFARLASIQEGECYANRDLKPGYPLPLKPRVQETIEFAHKMDFRRLGIAFCDGMKREAEILTDILEDQGFEVASVQCKVGRTPKEFLGLKEEQKIAIGSFEPMCSPITQALVLNAAGTDFNIIVGLCVGHDSLVMRYSEALCTVLVAKDRVTGHNPAAALYVHHSYYRRLRKERFGKGGALELARKEYSGVSE
jgi:uncharacterized metal-binding protein